MTTDKFLSDRLKGMLLETNVEQNKAQNPRSRPLIEVLSNEEEEEGRGVGGSCSSSAQNKQQVSKSIDNDGDGDDDDDDPPPIYFHAASAIKHSDPPAASSDDISTETNATRPKTSNDNDNNNMPSLAEQLFADATKAKREQQKQQNAKEQRRAKKSTFGLKKGFLNASSSNNGKTKIDARRREAGISKLESEKKKREESNAGGDMISITTNRQQGTIKNSNPLQLPEVQSAMLSHLESNSSQWATSDLLDSLPKKHPKLAQGMSNPQYMSALKEMQANPKQTLDRLKNSDPDIFAWLMEFCGVMGEHFCRLGEGQQEEGGGKKKVNDEKVREMGPLEKKAFKKHQHNMQTSKEESAEQRQSDAFIQQQPPSQRQSKQHTNPSNEMNNQVSSILANDELRSILLDPKIQQIMEECAGSGGSSKLRYYMGHVEYGPKLRKLMEAGLVRFA